MLFTFYTITINPEVCMISLLYLLYFYLISSKQEQCIPHFNFVNFLIQIVFLKTQHLNNKHYFIINVVIILHHENKPKRYALNPLFFIFFNTLYNSKGTRKILAHVAVSRAGGGEKTRTRDEGTSIWETGQDTSHQAGIS